MRGATRWGVVIVVYAAFVVVIGLAIAGLVRFVNLGYWDIVLALFLMILLGVASAAALAIEIWNGWE